MSQPNSAASRYSNPKLFTNSLKNPQDKLTVDLHKFELKSLADTIGISSEKSSARLPGSQFYSQGQQAYPHQHYSPTSTSRKAPINPTNRLKNAGDKKGSLKLSLETLDFKEAVNVSKKAYPMTSKAIKTSIGANPMTEKAKPGLKKSASISKEDKVRSFLSSCEGIFDRKSPTNKDLAKLRSSLEQKDDRNNFMEKPPKKSSLPNNLTLTLSNIYGGTGSSSYRTPSNSGPLEFAVGPSSTGDYVKGLKHSVSQKYKSKKSETDEDIQYAPMTNSSNAVPQAQLQTYPGQVKYSFNNLLIDLAKISTDPNKNISKISINNINNINTINNSPMVADERIQTLKDSNDVVNILKEKNDEIQKLTRDKMELKATVEMLVSEINSIKQATRLATKEKDENIENLTQSLIELLGSTTNESKEIYKESAVQSARMTQCSKKTNSNSISKDMESVKMMVDQLKTMTDNSEKAISKALEQKNCLIETLTRENQRKNKKGNYMLTEADSKDSRKGHIQVSSFNLYQRSSSAVNDEMVGKKTRESPYYEAVKSSKKGGKPVETVVGKKTTPSLGGMNSKRREGKRSSYEKGDLMIDTQDLETVHTLVQTQPSTSTNAELEILKRKFSHDPKKVSEAITEMLEKRSVGGDIEECYSYGSVRENEEERIDIGKALNGLKGRIEKMLGKYKERVDAKKAV